MKRIWMVTLGLLLLALPLGAQTGKVGGKYSSYSTDLDVGFQTVSTDREKSLGVFVDYRSGIWVFKGELDSDSKSPAQFDFAHAADYSRDRLEVIAGYGALPFMDLELGLRSDKIDFNAFTFDGINFGNLSVDQTAAAFGVHFHTTQHQALGWYALVRGYIGTADVTGSNSGDSNGYRAEMALTVPIGSSGWEVAPGVETERIDVSNIDRGGDLRFNSNRLFVKFAYNWGR